MRDSDCGKGSSLARIVGTWVLLLGVLVACGRESANQGTHGGPQFGPQPSSTSGVNYCFAVHPLHNPAKLTRAYQPLVDYLNSHLQGAQLSLEASRDYASFKEKFRARNPSSCSPIPGRPCRPKPTPTA